MAGCRIDQQLVGGARSYHHVWGHLFHQGVLFQNGICHFADGRRFGVGEGDADTGAGQVLQGVDVARIAGRYQDDRYMIADRTLSFGSGQPLFDGVLDIFFGSGDENVARFAGGDHAE